MAIALDPDLARGIDCSHASEPAVNFHAPMNFTFKFTKVFRAFATKTTADAVKSTVIAVAAAALAPPILATLLGVLSKGLIETLVERASRVEGKLDRLVREPLISGLRLLRQALQHGRSSPEEERAYESLLEGSHASFTRAFALVSDSREDSVFVRALDCVALAAHKGHRSLALIELREIGKDIGLIKDRVQLLESEALAAAKHAQSIDKFLQVDDPYGPKPFGYFEQRGVGIRRNKLAARLKVRADTAREHLEILEGIVLIAKHLVDATGTFERI